jgi:hypothetical protein
VRVDAPLIKWSGISSLFKTRGGEIGSVAIGIATFGALTNWRILNPLFVRWLYWGDPSTSYLGWQFFRKTPFIQFPIGASPNYGVGFSSSIMFTDSVPLIAIPLKYLSFLLPHEFQYFGLWILAAFVLQAWFAWKMLSHFISNLPILLFGVMLFTNAPTLIYRMVHEGSGHIGFIGQFLILWAICLYLDEVPTKKWMPILVITPLIWIGFIPIVLILYVCGITQQIYSRSIPLENKVVAMFVSVLSTSILVIGTLWLTGGLEVSEFADSGFGYYRTSLTSLFDPQIPGLFSFSQIIPNLHNLPGSQEGFAFLGVPSLFLIFACFIFFNKNNPLFERKHLYLYIGVIGMGVFSLSNRISILGRELFVYPIPREVLQIISPFRASGRFVWPLVYVAMLFAITSISGLLTNKRRLLTLLLLVLAATQLIDSMPLYRNVRDRYSIIAFTPRLTSPMWDALAQNYDHIVAIPPLNNDPGWFELALLADKWGMSTNTTYLARFGQQKFMDAVTKTQNDLNNLSFDSKTLYVITNYPPNPMNRIVLNDFGPGTNGHIKSYSIDGFTIIAP